MKALLLVSICLLALVTACSGSSPPSTSSSGESSAASDRPVPPVSASPAPNPSGTETKIVVESTMALEVPVVRDAYTGVQSIVRGLGGYVAQGKLTDDSRDSADLRLRVPAARHDDLLASLRSLTGAKVRREESNATEVTAQFTDLNARLRNLQRSESQYQTLLDRAGSIGDVVQVTAKLDDIRGQIETTQGRLNVLNDSTELATVTLSLSPPGLGSPTPARVFAFALHASRSVGLVMVNVLVACAVFAAWLLPLAIVALLVWRLVGRRVRRVVTFVLSL